MIRIVLPSRTLALTFEHQKIMVPIIDNTFDLAKPSHRVQRRTKCEILECDPVNPIKFTLLSEGFANCHPKDIFKKDTGRRISLTNAMKIFKMEHLAKGWMWRYSKFERKAIWEGYLNRNVDPIVLAVEKVMRDELTAGGEHFAWQEST